MNITILNDLVGKTSQFSADEIFLLWELLYYQKDDFLTADAQALDCLIKVFAKAYWDSDTLLEQDLLMSLFKELSPQQKQEVIAKLINNAKLLPDFINFALTLMTDLPVDLQKEIDIYPSQLFKDGEGTLISQEEFDYCNRCGLDCHMLNGKYYRPIKIQDTENFYNILQICLLSGKPSFMFIE